MTKVSLCKHSKHCPMLRSFLRILKYAQRSPSAVCLQYYLLLCKGLILHCSALLDPNSLFLLLSFIIQRTLIRSALCLELAPYSSSNFLQTNASLDTALVLQATLIFYCLIATSSKIDNIPNSQRFTHRLCSISKCKFLISMHKLRWS